MAATGCFYPGPLPELVYNVPPELIAAAFENGEPIPVGESTQRVFVLARDDDGDTLEYLWNVPGRGVLGTATAIPNGSQVELTPEDDLGGHVLSCIIYDTEGNVLSLSWPLEGA